MTSLFKSSKVKFKWTLKVLSSYGLDNGRKVSVEWKVKGRIGKDKGGETKRKMVLSKTADWEEEFSFKCSMSPTKSGKFPFEDKTINFVILEEDAPGKKGKPLGKCDLNLAEFTDAKNVQKIISIELKKPTKDAPPTLMVQLNAEPAQIDNKKLVKTNDAKETEKDKPKVQIGGEEYNVVTSEDVSEQDKSASVRNLTI